LRKAELNEMSGLLDKATGYSDSVHQGDNVDKKVVNDPDAIIQAYEKGKKAVDAVVEAVDATFVDEVSMVVKDSGRPDNNTLFNILGAVSLLIILGIVFYNKYVDWLIFGPAIAASWALYNGAYLIVRRIDYVKLGTTAVAWLVIAGVITSASFMIGSSSGVKIASIEFEDDANNLRITMFGSSGTDFDISVTNGGTVLCSDSASIGIDRVTVSLPVEDCWAGNAYDHNGAEVLDYIVNVHDGENTDTYTIPARYMSREATAGLVKVTEITTSETGSGSSYNEYNGIQVDVAIGIGDKSQAYSFSNGHFSGIDPWWIKADWNATINIYYEAESEPVETFHNLTSLEGSVAGSGDFHSGWVYVKSNTGGMLERGHFYDDDGCYTFEVSITSDVSGQTVVDSRSQIEFHWNDNEADEDTSNDQPAESC
jgi:hypothetical protein